jgi:alkanesulfonate monooxygenase SsuD/methylene tetrahydromethanopterin reductase-like flavin-dependent oxidoreductase (luciferase family)
MADQSLSDMYQQPFTRYLDKFCAVGTQAQVEERLSAFLDAGVSDLLLAPQVPPERYPDQLNRLSEATSALRRRRA